MLNKVNERGQRVGEFPANKEINKNKKGIGSSSAGEALFITTKQDTKKIGQVKAYDCVTVNSS